jgi:hypothetical protein
MGYPIRKQEQRGAVTMFETGKGEERVKEITLLANDAVRFEASGVP